MADRYFQTAIGGNMTAYPDILYAVKDRVATITLNRPEKLNAYTPQMANSLRLAMADAAKDTNVRAIVLTGAGRGFCAGADMQVLTGIIGGNRSEATAKDDPAFASKYGPSLDEDFGDMKRFAYFMRIKKPIVAAINGPAAGIGLIMALYADMRLRAKKPCLPHPSHSAA